MRRSVLFFSFLLGAAACSSDPGSSSSEFADSSSATEPPVASTVRPPYSVLHDGEFQRPDDGARPGGVPATERHAIELGGDEAQISVTPCERLRLCGAGLETPHIHRQ